MNAAQLVGICGFGVAALLCFWARWPLIGAINATLSLECVIGLRFGIHDIGEQVIGQPYPGRDNIKVALIIVALMLMAGLISSLLRPKSRRGPPFATAATFAALMLFCIETISLEAIDKMVYRFSSGMMVIGWLWLVLALVVAGEALWKKVQKRAK